MNVLVTGGSGFVGRHLVKALLEAGHVVINCDKLTYASDREPFYHPRYAFEQIDITDAFSVNRVLTQYNPSAIIHLAAETHVDNSIARPSDFVHTNVTGTSVMLQAAVAHNPGIKFIYSSTDEVYGELGFNDEPFTESSPYAPRNPYSATKAAGEMLAVSWHATYGLPVAITNSGNNYGVGQHGEKLIPKIVRLALQDKPLTVYGNGQQVRDWIHVSDHVSGIMAVLRFGEFNGTKYNIGADCEFTNIDLVRHIKKYTGSVSSITYVAGRPTDDKRYALDTSKLREDLMWEPAVDINEGIQEIIEDEKSRLSVCGRVETIL